MNSADQRTLPAPAPGHRKQLPADGAASPGGPARGGPAATPRNPVGNWAILSLLVALLLVVIGFTLERGGLARFWGGLIAAFGEAALVGGLADWFAVRALFGHPLGIKIFPHTALIPRNRQRIVREVRNLVQNEWLTKEMLITRINAFDFVTDGVLAMVAALKPKLRNMLRTVAREVFAEISPQRLAAFLAQAIGHSIEAGKAAPFLASAVQRVREDGWLGPLLREWVLRFQEYARSEQMGELIHRRLQNAATEYSHRDFWKKLTMMIGEATGGIDLQQATQVIQQEIARFAEDQLAEESQLHHIVQRVLLEVERRLREDTELARKIDEYCRSASESGSLNAVIGPVLAALQGEALAELEREDSPVLAWVMDRLEEWAQRLAEDPETRDRLNAWFRRMVGELIEKHHSLIGAMVEEQLNRFSDENLVEMIEAKVGEDLNWIRINGSLVGGLVGVLIYLTVSAVDALCHWGP